MNRVNRQTRRSPLLAALLTTILTVCLPVAALCEVVQTGVVATVAADYSSGATSVIDVDPAGGPRAVENDLAPTISDIVVAAYESAFYRLERFMGDNVTKFDISAPATPIYQYSVLDDGDTASANPHAMIFLNDQKAYLLLYGKTKAWIVNPSAATEAEFKIGELDLSAYGDSDGIPEMDNGVIVDGILYITLQRQDRDNEWAPGTAYLALFDTTTDTEIDTNVPNDDNVLGIPLPIKNPGAIQYLETNDTIYVQGVGDYGSFSGTRSLEYAGGIATVDPSSYITAILVDDGDDDDAPYGLISSMAIVSADKGYFIGYDGFGDNTLYEFSPTTGDVSGTANDDLMNKSLAGLAVDQNDMLWVCNQSDAQVAILDTADNTIDQNVGTKLNPSNIAFTTEGTAGSGGSSDDDDSTCFIDTVFGGLFLCARSGPH